MKKFLVPAMLVVTVGLGGCAQQIQEIKSAWGVVTGATVTAKEVYIAAETYDAIEVTATTYLKLPVCGSQPCRNPAATKPITAAIRSGRLARNTLEKAVNANPTGPVDANLFATLTSSTSTLKAIMAEYGVK